jgi:hypothetical protein
MSSFFTLGVSLHDDNDNNGSVCHEDSISVICVAFAMTGLL